MTFIHALTSTKPTAPFSVKALIYAILCTLFGTAFLFCGINLFFMEAFGSVREYPYEAPAVAMGLGIAMIFVILFGILWLYTVGNAARKWLNILLGIAVVVVGFCPSFLLMNLIYRVAEQVFRA